MKRVKYSLFLSLRRIWFRKKQFALYILAFYIGLLLPAFCMANLRAVDQIFKLTTFNGIEESVQIDCFNNDIWDIKNNRMKLSSISAYYEETFDNREYQYMSVHGIDDEYPYIMPDITGEGFCSDDYANGNSVCVISKKDALNISRNIGDSIEIKGKQIKIIGMIDDYRYDGIYIPLSTMQNVYSNDVQMQIRYLFIPNKSAEKKMLTDNIVKQIEEDENAQLISVTDGQELLELAKKSRRDWRLVRIAVAIIAIAFFIINESMTIIGKMESEKRSSGIMASLGASRKLIFTNRLFETLIVTSISSVFVLLSIIPLANIAEIKNSVNVDISCIVSFISMSFFSCSVMTIIISNKIDNCSIAEQVGIQDA